MDRTEAKALQARLEDAIRDTWSARDPDVQASSLLRDDDKIDVTVVSRLFEGKDALEREAFFWPSFVSFSRSDLIHMTYCLLLTPGEAERHFARSTPVAVAESWE